MTTTFFTFDWELGLRTLQALRKGTGCNQRVGDTPQDSLRATLSTSGQDLLPKQLQALKILRLFDWDVERMRPR